MKQKNQVIYREHLSVCAKTVTVATLPLLGRAKCLNFGVVDFREHIPSINATRKMM